MELLREIIATYNTDNLNHPTGGYAPKPGEAIVRYTSWDCKQRTLVYNCSGDSAEFRALLQKEFDQRAGRSGRDHNFLFSMELDGGGSAVMPMNEFPHSYSGVWVNFF